MVMGVMPLPNIVRKMWSDLWSDTQKWKKDGKKPTMPEKEGNECD